MFSDEADNIKLIDVVRRLNGEKPPKPEQEEYEVPARIRFLKNRIEIYQRQADDLCEDRRKAIEDLFKFNAMAEKHSKQLSDNLANIEMRLKVVEHKLAESYDFLEEEMIHL